MNALITFWSHALAAMLFASLLLWRLSDASRQTGQRMLLAAFAMTACWAWLEAVMPHHGLVRFAESARNLIWIGLLYNLSSARDERQHGVRWVYGAVGAVIGLQLVADALNLLTPGAAIAQTSLILRVTTAAGALVLVHNFYGQAAPASRSHIRLAMLGLAWMWGYDLNYYTISYIGSPTAFALSQWRGVAVALSAPLFALGARHDQGWRFRLSRAATFQSLSLLGICAYFALMAIVATALRGTGVDWSATIMISVLAVMTVGAMVLLPSARARGWAKVKLTKHLFEHRYDYRTEWLRFTETLGHAGPDAAPLGERIVKAFADIVDAPGGLLLVSEGRSIAVAANWNWPSANLPAEQLQDGADFWNSVENSGRILEVLALREGWATAEDKRTPVPACILNDPQAWAVTPLIHHDRLVGIIVLAAPDYHRPLDWEDFDLLRTAGRQAASSLAEALGQEALSNAQRFEEFNRRFAFILHDVKNLVSQLSLVARNAERHADNPEFRADMVATLKSSVGKMNDLLARLSPRATARVQHIEAQPLRQLIANAVAATRGDHEVRLIGDAGHWAQVDGPALEQALGHVIQNAVDACSANVPVMVRVAAAHADGVSISVADKGVGMDSDFIRNRLFQPFSSSKPGGFGIGAFEARSLITAMGGRLTVDSTPGKGTTFTITLPAAAAVVEPVRKRA